MWVKSIEFLNFRNYKELALSPHPGVNLFFGRNGSGKTNLLEAVHYCSLGRSHRISNDANAVKNGEAFALSSVLIQNGLGQLRQPQSQEKSQLHGSFTSFLTATSRFMGTPSA